MVNGSKTRVFVVDDQRIMLDGISFLLNRRSDLFELIGEARDGQKAVKLAGRLNPDLIVMDFNMPIMDGIEASREIIVSNPESRILIMSSDINRSLIEKAIETGVIGVISKDTIFGELFVAIEEIMAGNAYFCPVVTDVIRRDGLKVLREDVCSISS